MRAINSNHIKGDKKRISTGYRTLDEAGFVFSTGVLTIIASSLGMGKTAFALNLVYNNSVKLTRPSAFLSLEMLNDATTIRLAIMDAKVDSHLAYTNNLPKADQEKLKKAKQKLQKAPIHFKDSVLSANDILMEIEALVGIHDIELAVIDFLQMIQPYKYTGNIYEETEPILSTMKALAKDHGIAIILTSRLRNEHYYPNYEHHPLDYFYPEYEDFEEGRMMEQIPDKVIFINRPAVYNPQKNESDIAEIHVRKNRSGVTGVFNLKFLPEYGLFEEM